MAERRLNMLQDNRLSKLEVLFCTATQSVSPPRYVSWAQVGGLKHQSIALHNNRVS